MVRAKILLTLSAISLLALSGCEKSSSPLGCWLDETGAQALELVALEGNAVRIQSLQGSLDGALSGDTLTAVTGEPLHETIRMVFSGSEAVYEFLGTQQKFRKVDPKGGCLESGVRE